MKKKHSFIEENAGKILCIFLAVIVFFSFAWFYFSANSYYDKSEKVKDRVKLLEYRKTKVAYDEKIEQYADVLESLKKPIDYLSLYKRDFFRQFRQVQEEVKADGEATICSACGVTIDKDTTICPACGQEQVDLDRDNDEMPDYWENKYGFNPLDPGDADTDKDEDGFLNLVEYLAGTDPLDPGSTPKSKGVVSQFSVATIFRKPVQLKLMGYINLGDSVTLQINWGGNTDFKKVGESIRGYKVVDFVKKIIPITKKEGLVTEVDQSFARIQKTNEEPIILEIKRIKVEKELYARIMDLEARKKYDVHVGSVFAKDYKVLDIMPKEVIIHDKDGEKYTLRISKKR